MANRAFSLALSRYTPATAELRDAVKCAEIERMELYKDQRKLAVTIRFDTYCDAQILASLAAGLTEAYGLSAVEISPRFSEKEFTPASLRELLDEVGSDSPVAARALSGCSILEEGAKIKLLAEGGAEMILTSLNIAEIATRKIGERFGIRREVVVAAATDVAAPEKSLVSYEAKMLAEVERNAPPPPPQQQPAQQAKPAAQPQQKRDRQPQRRTPRPPAPTDIPPENILIGQPFGETSVPLSELQNQTGRIAIEGAVFAIDTREIQEGRSMVINMDITDKTGSVRVKRILPKEDANALLQAVDVGTYLRIRGEMEYDRFYEDYTMKPIDLYISKKKIRPDNAEKKRVELHLHTTMSRMDGVSSAHDLIGRAKAWGHTAIAVTDHGVTQGYPEALHSAKGIKILYGCEAYFVNDMQDVTFVAGSADAPLTGEFICFDIESTGTNPQTDGITEIAAVLVRNGEICESFQTY
ncbi:MAG: PHP domain-containing protein, partial [Clostridia bacterium]|nr:PHP domain-containing protein [Clostridia bacterium]